LVFPEEHFAAADDERTNGRLQNVEEAFFQQGLTEQPVPPRQQVSAGAALSFDTSVPNVAANERRIVPSDVLQRGGETHFLMSLSRRAHGSVRDGQIVANAS